MIKPSRYQDKVWLRDPARYRPRPNGFQCGEQAEESGEVGSVTFYCSEPPEFSAPNYTSSRTESKTGNGQMQTHYLTFSCRKPSVGVLLTEQDSAMKDEELEAVYEIVDPNFFDAGYGLAGATGFQIWAGSRFLVESLMWPKKQETVDVQKQNTTAENQLASIADHPILVYWQKRFPCAVKDGGSDGSSATKVLELGAGIGVVGASLAAAGAQVLLTDLTTLVENATYPNLVRNSNILHNDPMDSSRAKTPTSNENDNDNDNDNDSSSTVPRQSECPNWLQASEDHDQAEVRYDDGDIGGGIPIGRGWAAAAPLDWRIPLSDQLAAKQYQDVDLIIASDCVWLVSMLDSLLDTVEALFTARQNKSAEAPIKAAQDQPPSPSPMIQESMFLLSFQRRNTTAEGGESANFTTVNRVVESVHGRGWRIECLAWRPVSTDGETTFHESDSDFQHESSDIDSDGKEKEIFLFAIQPQL